MERNLSTRNEVGKKYYMRKNINEILKKNSLCLYFFLIFFEPYLNGVLGSVTKYYIFILIVILWGKKKIVQVKKYQLSFLLWLIYKFVSLVWTSNFYIFEIHMFSQIGMVLLLLVLTSVEMDKDTIDGIVKTMWFASGLIGTLAIFKSHPYHGEVTNRQVLLLFGQEADPNNQAAFLVIGITISLYMLLREKKYIVISIAILIVNAYSLFITGSRGGLVSILVVVLFLLIADAKNRTWKSNVLALVWMILIVYILYYVVNKYLPVEIYERLFEFETYEGGSERDIIWKNTLELFSANLNPIFGAGWGDYYGYNGYYMAVHNTYLSMLCDVGIIGFGLFFVPIIMCAMYLLCNKEMLPVLLLVCGLCPSFFIDAINKRFFWSVIMLLFVLYNYVKKEKKLTAKANKSRE